jgi:hypothetical protein
VSRSYDSAEDSTHATPFGLGNSRCLEYTPHGAGFNVFVYIDGATSEIIYAYGDDDTWTTTSITGAGSPTGYDTAAIQSVAMKICPNDEYVHIAFVADSKVIYCRLDDPDDPTTAGKWHTFQTDNIAPTPNTKFQRVDSVTGNSPGVVSITVDDSTKPAGNGADRAHIAWDENNGGTLEVWYNYGDQGPGQLEFNNVLAILLDADGKQPAIINIMNKGRLPHVYFIDSNGDVHGFRCKTGSYPGNATSWTGPESDVNASELVLLHAGGLTTIDDLAVSYHFDMEEFVEVAGVETDVDVYTRQFVGTGVNPAWMPQHTVSGYAGDPQRVDITNIRGNNVDDGLAEYRLFIITDTGVIEHGVEEYDGNSDLVWDNNTNWYNLADTLCTTTVPTAAEWRSLEYNDVAAVYRRSHALWKEAALNNLWSTRVRENTPPSSSNDAPDDGAVLDELSAILLDWTPFDSESDTQDDYDVEVADNNQFTSPIVDPGWAGAGTATSQHNITGGTLAADTLYYWRVRLKDDEKGDEYDPYSTGSWATPGNFYTTPQLKISFKSADIQTASTLFDIDMILGLICDMDIGEALVNAELEDGVNDFAQYRYKTTGDWSAWANMTIDVAACTEDPDGSDGGDGIPTGRGGGVDYLLVWSAGTDLNALQTGNFYGQVEVRVRGQYYNDSKSLGLTDWEVYPYAIDVDFKDPAVTAVWPDGDTLVGLFPTLQATISDDNGFESKFQLDKDPGFGSVDAGHDSGFVDSAQSFTPTTALTTGVWYWRVMAKDKFYPLYNDSSWFSKSFTIAAGGFVPVALYDGSNTVTFNITSTMEVRMVNALVEYENIRNDFDETAVLQNIPEYRGHQPLEINMDVLFYGGEENQTDIKRVHTWQRDETKLTFQDSAGAPMSIGLDTVSDYAPDKFKVVGLTPVYRAGILNSFVYEITIREVPA